MLLVQSPYPSELTKEAELAREASPSRPPTFLHRPLGQFDQSVAYQLLAFISPPNGDRIYDDSSEVC